MVHSGGKGVKHKAQGSYFSWGLKVVGWGGVGVGRIENGIDVLVQMISTCLRCAEGEGVSTLWYTAG